MNMKSKQVNTQKHNSDNPFSNANTPGEKEKVWNSLKKVAKPISKEDFFKRLKDAGAM